MRAQQLPAAPCTGDSALAALDFWIGSWDVYTDTVLAGTNRITKILRGCAITEEWTDAAGRRGQSLFYYVPSERLWKQVWVTEQALVRGGLKEKHLVARLPGGGVRFAGELALPDGRRIIDRTTLTPEARGEVRQLIEISMDGGVTWRTTFDARYRRGDARSALSAADEAAIRAVDSAYVASWLRSDTAGVLATFDSSAVLIPPGHDPVQGHERIRSWWWPAGGPAVTITRFDSRIEEISGSGDVAWVRMRSTVEWTTGPGASAPQRSTNLGLSILRRGPDGRWRIHRHAWGPSLPR